MQTAFEPDGVYAGIPYKVLNTGQIDAMMAGGLVRFKTMEQMIAAVSGGNIRAANFVSSGATDASISSLTERGVVKSAVDPVTPPPVLVAKSSRGKKIILWVILTPIIGFLLLFFLAIQSEKPPKSAAERILEACEKEFGARGEIAVNDCTVSLALKTLSKAELERWERAYNRSR